MSKSAVVNTKENAPQEFQPAARAGLAAGDRIVPIDGVPVRSPSEVAARTNAKPGGEITFRVVRAGGEFDAVFTTEIVEQGGRTEGIAGGRLKIDPATAERLAVTVRYGVVDAFAQGARKTWEFAVFTLRMLGRMVVGDASLKNISGPINIAQYAGYSASIGMAPFLSFLAVVSISLGILNVLPVPMLDGGQIAYQLVEAVKGSPLSERSQNIGQQVGIFFLLVLMSFAFYNDISRLLG